LHFKGVQVSRRGTHRIEEFGSFNFPEKGENLLAKIDFTPQQLFSAAKPMEEVFWLPIEPNFFNIATTLQVHSMVFPHSVFIA
jgi:hypothetical protein